jgi:hypothetical protein
MPKTHKPRRKRRYVIKTVVPVKSSEKEKNWDGRFATTVSQFNKELHPFYRQYFDKPPKRF